MSAGAGYRYLLRDTACGDVSRDPATPLTAYYTDPGYPPGSWWGAGLAGLGDDGARIAAGAVVTELEMARVFGAAHDPITDRPLGRPYPVFRTVSQRIDDAVAALPAGITDEQRQSAADAVARVEKARRTRSAVAGFDVTFTASKSASVLWALSDTPTQVAVVAAHRAAVRDALALLQERALFTRVGARSCAQVPTRGMVAALFDHWDTRNGDPNLHTHAVIANRVQGLDGAWRSLDSRALHHAVVAISEVYDNLFADEIARRLPVSWSFRDRGPRRTPGFELDQVPEVLLTEFSTRSAAITAAMTDALVDFHATHGRGPTRVETTRIRQRVTLRTRPAKTRHALPELMTWWRHRAARVLDDTPRRTRDASSVATRRSVAATPPDAGPAPQTTRAATDRWVRKASVRRGLRRGLRSTDIPDAVIADLASVSVTAVLERRSTWTRWNLLAEVARTTRPLRCRTVADRHALHDRVVAAALAGCVSLETPDLFSVPSRFRRDDGSSVFTRPGEDLFTHPAILDAESRLLTALDDLDAPVADPDVATAVTAAPQPARHPGGPAVRLAPDQAQAVTTIAASGRRLEVLVGPAGTGKTTTLRALRTVWEQRFGAGSVTGLAPSATAAAELAAALGVHCENTAKWLHESTGPAGHQRQAVAAGLRDRIGAAARVGDRATASRAVRALHAVEDDAAQWQLRSGQLVIVDEASLAGTLTLDTLAAQASAAGAKLLLVGDHHQLSAVDAGGGFGLLATTPAASELRSLWRFAHRWEAHATRALRRGDPSVLSAYTARDRIHTGTTDAMLDAAYDAWTSDQVTGQTAILLAPDAATVAALNERAHLERAAAGQVDTTRAVTGAGGVSVGVGDVVLTRRNNRRLTTTGGDHVRNGTVWTVTATDPSGSVTLATQRGQRGSTSGDGRADAVLLPAEYVREHLELGYATTVHRAQGITVAHAHVLAGPGTTREALYVAMTRGSGSNHLYLPTDQPDEDCHGIPDPGAPEPDAREVLTAVLARSGREVSATEVLRQRGHASTSPAVLLPIRDTLLTGGVAASGVLVNTDVETRQEITAAVADIDHLLSLRRDAHHLAPSEPSPADHSVAGTAPDWQIDTNDWNGIAL